MRLLDTHTGHFVEKDWRNCEFKYAILSHTWDANGEQTYKEVKKIQKRYPIEGAPKGSQVPTFTAIWEDGNLSPKILKACRVARARGYRYIWIDSCCIDQTSSSELSEAINCMYTWYKEAHVCYVYLADVPSYEDPKEDGSAFRGSRWFRRGWTLQELLASWNLIFLSADWCPIGSKKELADIVSTVTGISLTALSQRHTISTFSVAQRLSWAARRETTRVEDRAYSLLGIFGINMPTLYGEGEGAFQRLQEEILRRIPDQSIFAWGHVYLGPQIPVLDNLNPGPTQFRRQAQARHSRKSFRFVALPSTSLLAPSPDNFADCGSVEAVPLGPLLYHYPDLPAPDYSSTPHGIRTHFPLIPLSALLHEASVEHFAGPPSKYYLSVLGCEHAGRDRPGHLLGRVCHVDASASGTKVLSRAFIDIQSFDEEGTGNVPADSRAQLIALSVEALSCFSALAKIDAVYLSHPDPPCATMLSDWDLFIRPHKGINLLLKKEHHAPARRLAYPSDTEPSAAAERAIALSLRGPNQDHPTTHWLTVTRPAASGTLGVQAQDVIAIEYTHTLELDGRRLTIVACISGTLRGRPIGPITITWIDEPPWGWHGNGCMKQDCSWKDRELVTLDNREGGTAEMELSMEFLAANHYVIDAYIEWCNESPCVGESIDSDSDSDSEEEYFTADEDDQVQVSD